MAHLKLAESLHWTASENSKQSAWNVTCNDWPVNGRVAMAIYTKYTKP